MDKYFLLTCTVTATGIDAMTVRLCASKASVVSCKGELTIMLTAGMLCEPLGLTHWLLANLIYDPVQYMVP